MKKTKILITLGVILSILLTSGFTLTPHIDETSYDASANYMGMIINILESDDSDYAVAVAEVYETLRNAKIAGEDLTGCKTTSYFKDYNMALEILSAIYYDIGGYGSNTDYMTLMIKAATDGNTYALKMGKIYETLRNNKIEQLGLNYSSTTYFTDYSTGEDILNAMFPPEPEPEPEESKNSVSDSDVDLLARVLYLEAGSNWIPDDVLYMVCSVVVNRINNSIWPNDLNGVLYQKGQFSTISKIHTCTPTDRCYSIARDVLENGATIPNNVCYFANFTQGSGVYYTYYNPHGSNLYFCYK